MRRGRTGLRGAAAALGLCFVVGAHATPAHGQQNDWVVASQGVTIDVDDASRTASVEQVIYLVPEDPARPADPEGSLTIELLVFGDATISDLRRANGDRVLMWPASGRRLMATVGPPFLREGATPYLHLSYTVEGAVEGEGTARHVRVSLVSGPVRPSGAEDDGPAGSGFDAMVRMPDGWRVTESFPTGLVPGGTPALAEGTHGVSLPVTPAMISFRAHTDGRWRPGFPFVVDVLIVTMLLGFSAFGWRHLQGVVSGRHAEGESAA